ncbi:protein of unknown function [uncultured Sphingopyxis sp.]|uniref:Uncharacterized protein n=1 Tax=uncultured Sphingopyxis sp. TaxID=310581 RepID=A0A1Y5Q2F6_9SPHN|nr:protein of unknown function [uncultured Sphingopyxis sp.]
MSVQAAIAASKSGQLTLCGFAVEARRNLVEGVADGTADCTHRGDTGDGDEGRDQAIFDGGGGFGVANELLDELHDWSPDFTYPVDGLVWVNICGLGRIGFEKLNIGRRNGGERRPGKGPPRGYMLVSAAFETLPHILLVEFATLPTATTAARKTRARISPYSTAVAALVDRISL